MDGRWPMKAEHGRGVTSPAPDWETLEGGISGEVVACTRTSLPRTWKTGRARTTEPTSSGWPSSRRSTTPMASSASTSRFRVAIQPCEDQKENCPDATVDGGDRYRSESLKVLLDRDSSRLGQGEECQEALHHS